MDYSLVLKILSGFLLSEFAHHTYRVGCTEYNGTNINCIACSVAVK